MTRAKRTLQVLVLVVISLTVLAAPARGGDWLGIQIGPGGFSMSFGSSNWGVYGSSWSDPGWRIDYHVALSGYGEWVWVDGLGQCWRPWVAVGWRPYTHGRWVWTQLGWTWVAYEPWGYFPHHYGSWALSSYGWVWTPGYDYRPANVVWVGSGGFVGWYPCAPRGWSHHHRGWRNGYRHGHGSGYDGGYSAGWHDAQYATFTRWNNFGAHDVSRHAVPYSATREGGSFTAARTRIAVPDRADLARRGIATPRMEIESRNVRAGDRLITVTRPKGAIDDVRRHAEPTVERALSRDAKRTAVTARQAADRAPVDGQRRTREQQSSVRTQSVRPKAARSSVSPRSNMAPAGATTGQPNHRQPEPVGAQVRTKDSRRSSDFNRPDVSGRATSKRPTDRHRVTRSGSAPPDSANSARNQSRRTTASARSTRKTTTDQEQRAASHHEQRDRQSRRQRTTQAEARDQGRRAKRR